MRDYAKTSRANLKKQVFSFYGDKCACCGETNPLFLTIDHINGGGRAERDSHRHRGERGQQKLRKVISEADRSKYQILCFNCNCGRARNKGICPHKVGI